MSINETEFDELRERQTRTEAAVDQLTTAVGQIADTQRQQQTSLSSVSSDMQSILTLLKTKDGKFDTKMTLTVLVPLGGFIAFFLAMYVGPIKAQVETNQVEFIRQMTDVRHELVEYLRSEGTPETIKHLAVSDERISALRSTVNELADRERRRLEDEAAIGRAVIRGERGKP